MCRPARNQGRISGTHVNYFRICLRSGVRIVGIVHVQVQLLKNFTTFWRQNFPAIFSFRAIFTFHFRACVRSDVLRRDPTELKDGEEFHSGIIRLGWNRQSEEIK